MGYPITYIIRPRFRWDDPEGPNTYFWCFLDIFCILSVEEVLQDDESARLPKLLFIGRVWQAMDVEMRHRLFLGLEEDYVAMFDRWWTLERCEWNWRWGQMERDLGLTFLESLRPSENSLSNGVIDELIEVRRKNREQIKLSLSELKSLLESQSVATSASRELCQNLLSEVPKVLDGTVPRYHRWNVNGAAAKIKDAEKISDNDPVIRILWKLNELLDEV